MGLLDSLLSNGNLLEDLTSLAKENPQLLQAAASLLNPNDASVGGGSGLTDVLASLQSSGLGDVVQSWLSSGPNQAVSVDAITQAIGGDALGQFAGQAGVNVDQAGSVLAGILPELVNQLSPKGQAPGSADLGGLVGGLLQGLSRT